MRRSRANSPGGSWSSTPVSPRCCASGSRTRRRWSRPSSTATLKLGQARGIALLAPAQAGLPVAEYAPNAVKKAIVGAGHAEKVQIRAMVRVLLPRATFDSDDAADALAIAICHAHHRQSAKAMAVLAG